MPLSSADMFQIVLEPELLTSRLETDRTTETKNYI